NQRAEVLDGLLAPTEAGVLDGCEEAGEHASLVSVQLLVAPCDLLDAKAQARIGCILRTAEALEEVVSHPRAACRSVPQAGFGALHLGARGGSLRLSGGAPAGAFKALCVDVGFDSGHGEFFRWLPRASGAAMGKSWIERCVRSGER